MNIICYYNINYSYTIVSFYGIIDIKYAQNDTEMLMYINSGYLNNSLLNYKDTKNPISIGCCGNYRLSNVEQLPTYRPKGRLDYQLIYIYSGLAHFKFGEDEEETIIPAGNFVLFYPKEYQNYTYYGKDHTEVYWIHFSGTNVKNVLREYNIDSSARIFRTGTQLVYPEIFKNIINEIQQRKTGFELIIKAYLEQLLVLISRNSENVENSSKTYIEKEVNIAQEYFSKNYSNEINIDEYATSRGMSISWFIRSFKDITGVTPLQYILSQRIINAQILLESTDYSVGEISSIVGYENQLYFSRLFTKQKGVSPREYRKIVREY